jgi:hypothetical protein
MIEPPKLLSKRLFFRYYPGADFERPDPVNLLSGQPIRLMLGYDCSKSQVKDAVRQTLGLHRLGYDVATFVPFYAADLCPERLTAEGPRWPLARLNSVAEFYPTLAKTCRDSHGHVYPNLYLDALARVKVGTPLPQAVSEAYFVWAPRVLDFLQEFATTKSYQLVRDWEAVKHLNHTWFRNGREAMHFACAFGACKREGAGRLSWSPLYKTAYGYRLTQAHLSRTLVK